MSLPAESQAQILWVKGPDGTTEYIDPRGVELIGRPVEEISGSSWFDLVHPDDVPVVRRCLEEGFETQRSYEVVLRMRSDGAYRPMIERGSPVLTSNGSVGRWAGTLTDIEVDRETRESRRRLENEANATRALLESLEASAPIGIVFVDTNFRYVRVNEKIAAIDGIPSPAEHVGRTVAEVVPNFWPILEPAYRRVLETGVPVRNIELTGGTAEDPDHDHSWLETISPVRVNGEIIGLGGIVVDITERKRMDTAMAALTEAAVDAIAAAAEARDPYTAGHQRRVSELSIAIARELGVSQHDVEGVRIAAKIHDIGKLRMPSEILNKPGALTAPEHALLREHAQAGYDIVQGIDFPWPIADMILQHHERIDGSGYPHQLVGEEILLGARIIAVADVVDAMSSHRPYRPSRGVTAALRHIEHESGTRLDACVVKVCVRLFRDRQFSFGQGRQRTLDRDL
jgi:PAS domain S-box-containing protein/putative nucleotidyltransferase with HDIG domain